MKLWFLRRQPQPIPVRYKENEMIEKYIKQIEAEFPKHGWLVRKLGLSDEDEFGSDGYFVHIYLHGAGGELRESFKAAGSKMAYAFRGALAEARRY
jgi:hypothetical protein